MAAHAHSLQAPAAKRFTDSMKSLVARTFRQFRNGRRPVVAKRPKGVRARQP